MLRISKETEVPEGEPFKGDYIGRAPLAEMLFAKTKHREDGFVVSVNAPWGSGNSPKSYIMEAAIAHDLYAISGIGCAFPCQSPIHSRQRFSEKSFAHLNSSSHKKGIDQ